MWYDYYNIFGFYQRVIILNIPDRLTDYFVDYKSGKFSISEKNFPYSRILAYIAFFAFLLRLVISVSYLNSYDTEWNIMWGVQLGNGFFSAYSHVNALDYPPLYLYPLYIVGKCVKNAGIGGYAPLRMLAIKFFPCLADSLTCVVLYTLASKKNKLLGLTAASLWAINPAVIFNCACWGQTDCVMMFMAAMLMLALDQKHVTAAGVLWAAMCSTKLQGLYLTPVVGMEVLTICFGNLNPKDFSISKIKKSAVVRFIRFVCAASLTLALVYLPFMIGSGFSDYQPELGFIEKFIKPVTVYSDGVAKYPYCTLNADNIYMLSGLNGVNDELKFLSVISYSGLSGILLVLSVCAVVALYLFGKKKSHWLAGFMLMECIFMLTCRQHERYQIITLILLAGAFIRLTDKRILTLFSLNSVVIFFNQFRVLSAVREKSNWWGYYKYTDGTAEWIVKRGSFASFNSLLNTALFVASMVFVLRYFFDDRSDEPVLLRLNDHFNDSKDI